MVLESVPNQKCVVDDVEPLKGADCDDLCGQYGRHRQLPGVQSHIACVVKERFKRKEGPFHNNRGLFRAFS